MTRHIAAALVVLLGAAASAQRPQPAPPASDLVELDVIALDRDDRPVTDLRRDEFRITDDGRLVELTTFAKVTALGTEQPDVGGVVLLMDDIGVPIAGDVGHAGDRAADALTERAG